MQLCNLCMVSGRQVHSAAARSSCLATQFLQTAKPRPSVVRAAAKDRDAPTGQIIHSKRRDFHKSGLGFIRRGDPQRLGKVKSPPNVPNCHWWRPADRFSATNRAAAGRAGRHTSRRRPLPGLQMDPHPLPLLEKPPTRGRSPLPEATPIQRGPLLSKPPTHLTKNLRCLFSSSHKSMSPDLLCRKPRVV